MHLAKQGCGTTADPPVAFRRLPSLQARIGVGPLPPDYPPLLAPSPTLRHGKGRQKWAAEAGASAEPTGEGSACPTPPRSGTLSTSTRLALGF